MWNNVGKSNFLDDHIFFTRFSLEFILEISFEAQYDFNKLKSFSLFAKKCILIYSTDIGQDL